MTALLFFPMVLLVDCLLWAYMNYVRIALIERSQFAHNPRCYVKGGISALKEHGFDGSWLEWFLKETETFQGE